MGYTHYFTVKKAKLLNKAVRKDLKRVLDKAYNQGLIQKEWNEKGKYELTEKHIRFNGIEDDGHETFYFMANNEGWAFCKTARKPYDKVVMQVLLILKDYFKDNLTVGSDGDFNCEWLEAIHWASYEGYSVEWAIKAVEEENNRDERDLPF
jgi:hypothetical protein